VFISVTFGAGDRTLLEPV